MAPLVPDRALDEILALQLLVGWAGEGRCSPRRLGWWDTDVIDEEGGGDLFARLLPRTHVWASLQAAREAARRVDVRARGAVAYPSALRTIFFLGFELDEQLGDRLAAHKRSGGRPGEVLPFPSSIDAPFSREKFVAALHGGDVPFMASPNGRRLSGAVPDAPERLVKRLAAALVPLTVEYPLPFYELQG